MNPAGTLAPSLTGRGGFQWRSATGWLAVLLALVPPLMFARVIATTGANAHSNDYLTWISIVEQVASGKYVWAQFFKDTLQAGVHCYAIPILVTVAIARFAAWSIDVTLYLALTLAVLKLLLVHDALTWRSPAAVRQAMLVLLSALFFAPAHVNVFTFGFTATHVGLTEFGFALGLWGVTRFEGRWLGLALSCAGAWIASWSWGSGLLVWPLLAVALPLSGFRRPGHFVLLLLCAAIAGAPYLAYGSLESSGTTVVFPVPRKWLPLDAAGWLFSGSFNHLRARFAGVAALAFLTAGLLWLRRGPPQRWRSAVPSLLCLGYSFGLMVPVVVLRGTLNSWYTTSFGFLWVGLAGLAARVVSEAPAQREERLGAAAFGLLTVGLLATNGGYEDKVYYLKTRGPAAAACLRNFHNASPICEQAMYQWQGGHPEQVDAMAGVLERNGWGVFAPHQEWTLQGDFALNSVHLERAPGAPEFVWTPGLVPAKASAMDYRPLNLLLLAPGKIVWPVTLPAGTERAVLKTGFALSESEVPGARAGVATFEISAGDEVLVRRDVGPDQRGWVDVELPLTQFAGQPIELNFRSRAKGAAHPWAMFRHPWISVDLAPGQRSAAGPSVAPPRTAEDLSFDLTDTTRWQPDQLKPVEGVPGRWWVQQDPTLVYLPPLDLRLDDYEYLAVTAQVSPNCPWRSMQVFYRIDGEPDFSEAHSLWIPLYRGPARDYLYSLKLLGLAQGARLTGLRVDPIVGPDGANPTWAEISQLRLVRSCAGSG